MLLILDVITFPENVIITSGLSILLHGVISLPDGTSCDENISPMQAPDFLEYAFYHKHTVLYIASIKTFLV